MIELINGIFGNTGLPLSLKKFIDSSKKTNTYSKTCLKKLRTCQISFIVVLIMFFENDVLNSTEKELIKVKSVFFSSQISCSEITQKIHLW